MISKCQKCNLGEIEYDAPAKLCTNCWYEWWYAGIFDPDTLLQVKEEWDTFLENVKKIK